MEVQLPDMRKGDSMSKKRKTTTPIVQGWTPFIRTMPVHNAEAVAAYGTGYEKEYGDFQSGVQSMWMNNRYVVIKKELEGGMTWLSIRHKNRKAIRDWRHFQRIKNELTDPGREAMEIYPAESRLVDEANQYHLWVFPEGYEIPCGFTERMVSDDQVMGPAKQRPLEESA
jgi:hypothetical protein